MAAQRFRKKPVVIEAFHVTQESRQDIEAWPNWMRAAWRLSPDQSGSLLFVNGRLAIVTLEGTMVVSDGDWLIRGVKGELYPCKPDIFEATYEPEGE